MKDLEQARRILEKLGGKLLQPAVEALESGATDLGVAVQCLQRVETAIGHSERNGPKWRALEPQLENFRQELRTAQELVMAAGNFYEDWARLVSAAEQGGPNYTAGGSAASALHSDSGKVMIHG